MPLTAEHAQAKALSPAQLQTITTTRTFEQIMALPIMERAEVLDYLIDTGAQVRMKANQKEDVTFSVADPYRRFDPERDEPFSWEYVIPGGQKEPKEFPARIAAHVASNRDQAQFGGATWTGGAIRDDGNLTPVQRVPENPKLISFELVQSARVITKKD
jgi:hypothetical protein